MVCLRRDWHSANTSWKPVDTQKVGIKMFRLGLLITTSNNLLIFSRNIFFDTTQMVVD